MTELLERINRHLEFLMDCAIEQSSVRASTKKLIDEIESVIRKPKSNAEKIRQMEDEELATQLEAFICNKVKECRREDISCIDCALKWLKQEVSEDAEH